MILDICAMLWESKNRGLVCFESNVIFVVSANLSLFLKNVFLNDPLVWRKTYSKGLEMVTFGLLRDLAQKELSEYLDKYAGTKVTIWCFFIWLVSKTKHTKADESVINWYIHFTPLAS